MLLTGKLSNSTSLQVCLGCTFTNVLGAYGLGDLTRLQCPEENSQHHKSHDLLMTCISKSGHADSIADEYRG